MKPNRIFLVRHGESEGNVDKTVYNHKPDPFVNLTANGRAQAQNTANILKDMVDIDTGIIASPYYRAMQTANIIAREIKPTFFQEDPRLREQEWTGYLRSDDKAAWEHDRDQYSKFFYRFDTGESNADVYDRISQFKIELALEEGNIGDLVIVGHGMTNRVILMKYLNLSFTDFERIALQKNCSFFLLNWNHKEKKYEIDTKYGYKMHPRSERLW